MWKHTGKKCKWNLCRNAKKEIILHLQAIIRSLIVGITPVDLWTSMVEIQGHDSFTVINRLLTDEKQSNLYLLLLKTSVTWRAGRPWLWDGGVVTYELVTVHNLNFNWKATFAWLLWIFSYTDVPLRLVTPRIEVWFTTIFIIICSLNLG